MSFVKSFKEGHLRSVAETFGGESSGFIGILRAVRSGAIFHAPREINSTILFCDNLISARRRLRS